MSYDHHPHEPFDPKSCQVFARRHHAALCAVHGVTEPTQPPLVVTSTATSRVALVYAQHGVPTKLVDLGKPDQAMRRLRRSAAAGAELLDLRAKTSLSSTTLEPGGVFASVVGGRLLPAQQRWLAGAGWFCVGAASSWWCFATWGAA